eukprot:scaffold99486_cov36-Phaeocystis_antarctica.AAC.1
MPSANSSLVSLPSPSPSHAASSVRAVTCSRCSDSRPLRTVSASASAACATAPPPRPCPIAHASSCRPSPLLSSPPSPRALSAAMWPTGGMWPAPKAMPWPPG